MLLLQQMIVLFIYMMIGYFCCKKGVLNEHASKGISWIVVNIANPGMPISAVINGDGRIAGEALVHAVIAAVVLSVVLIILSLILPIVFRVPADDQGVYRVMTAFNNIGFMGFPIISATYGSEALLYASVFLLPFNISFYTYGIRAMKKERENGGEKFRIGKIFNVGVIASIIAIVLYLTQLTVPQFLKTAFGGISDLTGPLSMMVIGVAMTNIRLRELFLDIRLLGYSAVKLLVIPILGMMAVKQIVDNEILCAVCMIMMATPAASMTVMLAQQCDGNVKTASKGVALTTILSVATIPIVSAIVF